MSIKDFRDLEIWLLGKKIVREVYQVTRTLPGSELYGISSQMQRAAVSIPSNIAEGFNRYQNNEFKRFLYIALGSCAELETQIEICCDLNFITLSKRDDLLAIVLKESRMISSLIKRIKLKPATSNK